MRAQPGAKIIRLITPKALKRVLMFSLLLCSHFARLAGSVIRNVNILNLYHGTNGIPFFRYYLTGNGIETLLIVYLILLFWKSFVQYRTCFPVADDSVDPIEQGNSIHDRKALLPIPCNMPTARL